MKFHIFRIFVHYFPKTMEKIDNLDRKILEIITQNARTPFKDVAEECDVSRAAIHQRVQRLIDMDLNVNRAQMSTLKLTSKMIKEMPLTLGERDIIKNLTLLPGVQSTGEFGTGFFVRGGGSDQNLILLEDVPIFSSSHDITSDH